MDREQDHRGREEECPKEDERFDRENICEAAVTKCVTFGKCEDTKVTLVDCAAEGCCEGCFARFLYVKPRLHLCAGRIVNVGVILIDKRTGDVIGQRGLCYKVPHYQNCERGTDIPTFTFVLPEEEPCMPVREVVVNVLWHYAGLKQRACTNED